MFNALFEDKSSSFYPSKVRISPMTSLLPLQLLGHTSRLPRLTKLQHLKEKFMQKMYGLHKKILYILD